MESFWVTLIACDPVMWVFHIFRNKLIRISNSNQRVETQGQNGACGRAVSSVEVSWWLSARYCFEPLLGASSVPGMLEEAILNIGNPEGPRQREGEVMVKAKSFPLLCLCKSCQIHNFCLFLKNFIYSTTHFFLGVHFCEF